MHIDIWVQWLLPCNDPCQTNISSKCCNVELKQLLMHINAEGVSTNKTVFLFSHQQLVGTSVTELEQSPHGQPWRILSCQC